MTKKVKSKKVKTIEWIVTSFFALIFVFVAVCFIDGKVHEKDNFNQNLKFGWGAFVVQTNSMEDVYPVGSAIITYKDDVNDIKNAYDEGKTIDLTFFCADRYLVNVSEFIDTSIYKDCVGPKNPSVMTHRLRQVLVFDDNPVGEGRYVFIVSGTNTGGDFAKSGQYQAVLDTYVLGVVKNSSSFLGAIFSFIGSVWGLFVLLLIPALYLIISVVIDMFKKLNAAEETSAEVKLPSGNEKKNSSLDKLSSSDKERLKQELLELMLKEKLENKKSENKDE